MLQAVEYFKRKGVKHFIFGDLYLDEIRTYRESKLNPHGIEVVEPIWSNFPEETIQTFLNSGLKAKIITTQADKLDESYIGQDLTPELINNLPIDVDVCGENGERSEEHTSELQSRPHLVCRLLLEKKKEIK